jgi:hypothetical protein
MRASTFPRGAASHVACNLDNGADGLHLSPARSAPMAGLAGGDDGAIPYGANVRLILDSHAA